jgi:Tfp pilus assembly protein PilF
MLILLLIGFGEKNPRAVVLNPPAGLRSPVFDDKLENMKICALLSLFLIASTLSAQDGKKLEPVYPDQTPGLIYIEGEDAVSTNFAARPTLDYGSSGMRMLQLNQGPTAPGAPFFADYVFIVDEPGDYELWLGGSPLGPKDLLLSSYTSPISYKLDDQAPVPVYREDTNVVDHYSLASYWSRVKVPLKLDKGPHRFRISVSEKRRYDNDYHLYLDAFFFLKTDAVVGQDVPPAFPKDRANRSIDNYFLSISQYESLIQANPKVLENYLQLSTVYTMVGDYQNALKVLARARVNAGSDPQVTLLLAKNRIWSGDWVEGLALFKDYLKQAPQDATARAELAKNLAWLGQYPASLSVYEEGLKVDPSDLNLRVNLGLTYLWANRIPEGEAQLKKAWSLASTDADKIKLLGSIYQTNGYPDKATSTYQRALPLFPGKLEFYLLLEEALMKQGLNEQAAKVEAQITSTFQTDDKLTGLLAQFKLKENLKQATLDGYEAALAQSPDDLDLRETLVEAYFWNGEGAKAIAETKHILVNKLYRQFETLKKELESTYQVLDDVYVARGDLQALTKRQAGTAVALKAALAAWQSADAAAAPKAGAEPDDAKKQAADKARADLAAVTAQAEALTAEQTADQARWSDLATRAQVEADKIPDDTKALSQTRPWVWNRAADLAELKDASHAGVTLAGFLLARLALDEQDPSLAAAYANALPSSDASDALRAQVQLWSTGTRGDAPADAAPAPDAAFTDDTAARAADALKGLTSFPAAAQKAALDRLLTQLHRHVMLRTQIRFYQNDLDTSDLRYQLGLYELDENQNKEARDQLERVLVLEPNSAPAMFNLGRARQLSGDWSGAMALYRTVYQTDPKYENAASTYNQLAREHANSLSSDFTSYIDNARATTQGRLDYRWQGSSAWALDGTYLMDTIRVYQQSTTVSPSSAYLQTLLLSPSFSLPDWNLTLSVKAGGVWDDNLLGAFVSAQQSVEPSDVFGTYSEVSPVFGAGATWAVGPLSLNGEYTFDQIKDTFLLYREVFYENKGEATATLYFPFSAPLILRGIGSRTYAMFASVWSPFDTTTNQLYSLLEEVNFALHIADAPETTLVLSGTATWDNADDFTEINYYAPNNIVTYKGGAQVNTQLNAGSGWVFGLSGRGALGTYVSTTESDLLSEGQFRVEAGSGDLKLFFDVSVLLTTRPQGIDYWSSQAVLGANLALPNYILK